MSQRSWALWSTNASILGEKKCSFVVGFMPSYFTIKMNNILETLVIHLKSENQVDLICTSQVRWWYSSNTSSLCFKWVHLFFFFAIFKPSNSPEHPPWFHRFLQQSLILHKYILQPTLKSLPWTQFYSQVQPNNSSIRGLNRKQWPYQNAALTREKNTPFTFFMHSE